jgi:type I restriction enzyme M protein
MPRPKATNGNGANLGFEARLWQTADALRNNMDAAEYKHVVLGLIFLKYISDAFEEQHARLTGQSAQGADPEDPDEYRAENIFWVPKEARWSLLKANARQATIGRTVDDAMAAIERDNPSLKGVLPKDYARPGLDKQRLGQLIDLVSNIGLGDKESRSRDILGRVYEYFLSQFASAEGKGAGQFYTPRCVVQVLVSMLAPYQGRVYDPCCGSGGMFVQSEKFIEAHGGRIGQISVYGQESNYTTWRLCKMNLAIRGIDGQIAQGDSFHNDQHPDLKADYVLANPPFNDSDWRGEQLKGDKRWRFGAPPASNANFAWVQHFIHHLAPHGLAGFVLANGSMSSNQSNEGEIRKAIIEADLVDCMVALPGQLFYSTQIPVCLWFLARAKKNGRPAPGSTQGGRGFRDRRGETLFIDARKMGTLVDRVHRDLTDEDVAKIAGAYHAWRGDGGRAGTSPAPTAHACDAGPAVGATLVVARNGVARNGGAQNPDHRAGMNPAPTETAAEHPIGAYADVPGFCRAVTVDEIRAHGHVLTPGRYVGAEDVQDDGEPFDEKMKVLTTTLRQQMAEAAVLDAAIAANLRELGYGG